MELIQEITKRGEEAQQNTTLRTAREINFSDNLFISLEKHPRAMNEKETTSKRHIHGNVERRNFV
jgi:hypothetical protein